ncbi:MAG: methyltransferase domain-containing protein [Candidatus Omnitrophica bacterium]|nr:methyltransferase domain-containing protein [Candidatus Omnitrophota bacterium]
MRRIVEPEILDHLDPNDPSAIKSRRDLRWLNWIMGHRSILSRAIRNTVPDLSASNRPLKVVELGGGDGSLLLRLAKKGLFSRVDAQLVDRNPTISEERLRSFQNLGWSVEAISGEAFGWMEASEGGIDLILTNLFFHHFENRELERWFELAASKTRAFIACDPRRDRFALIASHLVGLIGCNAVTRNDAVLSVRAGFSGNELTQLWPHKEGWRLQERRAGMFSHLFVAVKE